MIQLPTVMINFKTYNESAGEEAEEIVRLCKEVHDETAKGISCCPQSADIYRCAQYNIPILAQHEDTDAPGGHTGKMSIKSLKENGALGSLVNHSEDRISFDKIKDSIHLLREAGLISVVCVRDVHEAKGIASLHPDIIAIEPPELIGGDVSVTTANPKIISQTVEVVHKIDPDISILCGAGVKTGKDVAKALELGAEGVLVASGVVKASDKKKAILDLVKGIN